jgi:hypothetical protein
LAARRRNAAGNQKTANELNKLPQALLAKAKANWNQISLAESRRRAEKAFDHSC